VRLGSVGQRPELVGHPARLERTGLLEVLGFEEESIVADRRSRGDARPGGGRFRAEGGRAVDSAGDALARGFDLLDRDEVARRVRHGRECMRPTATSPDTCVFAQAMTYWTGCWIASRFRPSPNDCATPRSGVRSQIQSG